MSRCMNLFVISKDASEAEVGSLITYKYMYNLIRFFKDINILYKLMSNHASDEKLLYYLDLDSIKLGSVVASI